MKFQFSIRLLLTAVSFVALLAAAICYPTTAWRSVYFATWLAMLAYATAMCFAAGGPGATVFARSFLCCVLLYILFTACAALVVFDEGDLPHNWLTELLIRLVGAGTGRDRWSPPVYPNMPKISLAEPFEIRRMLVPFVSSAFGLLGGGLGLWRYRVTERRAKETSK